MSSASQARTSSPSIRVLTSQFLFIALVLGAPYGIATTPFVFRDGDTSWQVAAGKWILGHGHIPTTDPFSFTAAGHPWVAMEWLSEVIFGIAYGASGVAGLAAVVAAAFIGLHAIIFFHLERRVPVALVAGSLVMLDFVLAPFVMARPHVLAWPLIAAWTTLLLGAAENGRPPKLWTASILVVWSNLHGSFPVAIAIMAAIAGDALIAARWTTIREWTLFGVASLVAVCLNANGIAGLRQPFETSSLATLPLIGEWHRSTPHATPFFFAVFGITVAALLWSRMRVPVGRLLLLLLLAGMALAHVRHQAPFAIVAACVVPALLRPMPSLPRVPPWLLLGAVPLLAFRATSPLTLPESEANPTGLIAAVPQELKGQRVFNSYIFGGPLILAGIKPYIDGRAEIYGDAFVTDYVNIASGDADAFNSAAERYDIRWTMLRRGDKRLIDAIESTGVWRRYYSNTVGVIDIRAPVPAKRRESSIAAGIEIAPTATPATTSTK